MNIYLQFYIVTNKYHMLSENDTRKKRMMRTHVWILIFLALFFFLPKFADNNLSKRKKDNKGVLIKDYLIIIVI